MLFNRQDPPLPCGGTLNYCKKERLDKHALGPLHLRSPMSNLALAATEFLIYCAIVLLIET